MLHAGTSVHKPQVSSKWGRRELTDVLITSTSEEPGSQPEHSPSRCSLSSKRPSLHGLGKRQALHLEVRQELFSVGSPGQLQEDFCCQGQPCAGRYPRSPDLRTWAIRGQFPVPSMASMMALLIYEIKSHLDIRAGLRNS